MALDTYHAKRDFSRTKEPKGADATAGGGDSFVIQKHAARRLHYDFRLEMDGVLKSWAVTRGPSMVAGEKRLAVHVEDHPLEYGGFEGVIPKGEYGGGSVIVWDRGRWTPIGDPHKAYAKGHMEFTLEGEKLHGRWHLVRMAHRTGEKHDNWLMIKAEDDFAVPAGGADILDADPDSVLTGRPVEALEGEAPGWSSKTGKIDKSKTAAAKKAAAKKAAAPASRSRRKAGEGDAVGMADGEDAAAAPIADPLKIRKATPGALPDFLAPQLATLVTKPPGGKRWIHEVKFDGYRLQARIQAGRVKLFTRSGLDWTRKFGKEIVAAFQDLPLGAALIDGEIVVENDAGSSDFSALQAALSEGRTERFMFYAFDLLHLDGADLTGTPLLARKQALAALLGEARGLIRLSEHFTDDGSLVLSHACRLSLEGIVSKISDAPFRSGRGKDWVKSKCSSRQELVIGGYTPSTALRRAIGSLAMGVYEDGKLVHVGRVGTGYSVKTAESLYDALERLRTDKSPFAEKLTSDEARSLRYVEPKLVAEVEFRAWTGDGHLRHASFRGLREDKPAREIVREGMAINETPRTKAGRKSTGAVTLTHPDRLYWPEEGVTKEGLASYYSEVWPLMAPFVAGRPLALLRAPDGVGGQSFFQKHSWRGMNKAISLFQDPQDSSEDRLLMINGLDGMIGLAQSGALEVHPWGATVADLERPDMIILDLDPGEGVAWERVISAACEIRDRLEAKGFAAFVKTSGGKGLHVVAPIRPSAAWPEAKAFTKALADDMVADHPDDFVATVTKSKRGGKILIDYLRNGRGATAVAPYSTRARKGAPVSMPLHWDELSPAIGPNYFTLNNALARLSALKSNPWDGFKAAARPIS